MKHEPSVAFCEYEGVIIGPSRWMPAEPFDRSWNRDIGCNNLVCQQCGAQVRQTLDRQRARQYACDCHWVNETDSHTVRWAGGSGFGRWRCAGHPPLTLPTVLDGVPLDDDTDWPQLAAQTIAQPPFAPLDRPAIWPTRLFSVLQDEPTRSRLAWAMAGQMQSRDAQLADGATRFFREAAGALKLLIDTMRPGPAAWSAMRALALAGLSETLLGPVLQEQDREWACRQAARLVAANPAWLGRLVDICAGLPGPDRDAMVHRIASADTISRQRLERALSRMPQPSARDAAFGIVARARAGLRVCDGERRLVGGELWLPTEAFEYQWDLGIGCNQLACQRCAVRVRSQVLADDPRIRYYRCGCQTVRVWWITRVDVAPFEHLAPDVEDWECTGHPLFTMPALLDGVPLSVDMDWPALVERAIREPPFRPPGVDLEPIWIVRLYRLLSDGGDRGRLAAAMAGLMESSDPLLIRGAFDFFLRQPHAIDTAEFYRIIRPRTAWLKATADPRSPGHMLHEQARRVGRYFNTLHKYGHTSREPLPADDDAMT